MALARARRANRGIDDWPGFVDLLSIRALFLFAAFFGLTGLVLSWMGTGEPLAAAVAVLTGLVVGLGGNYFIKRVGYEHVSSDVSASELKGVTARVLVPFEGGRKGKISLVARGARIQRPLWASTSTKNPDYRDTLYVEELVAPRTVNTSPAPVTSPRSRPTFAGSMSTAPTILSPFCISPCETDIVPSPPMTTMASMPSDLQ